MPIVLDATNVQRWNHLFCTNPLKQQPKYVRRILTVVLKGLYRMPPHNCFFNYANDSEKATKILQFLSLLAKICLLVCQSLPHPLFFQNIPRFFAISRLKGFMRKVSVIMTDSIKRGIRPNYVQNSCSVMLWLKSAKGNASCVREFLVENLISKRLVTSFVALAKYVC